MENQIPLARKPYPKPIGRYFATTADSVLAGRFHSPQELRAIMVKHSAKFPDIRVVIFA